MRRIQWYIFVLALQMRLYLLWIFLPRAAFPSVIYPGLFIFDNFSVRQSYFGHIKFFKSPHRPLAPSPFLPIAHSPHRPFSPSPTRPIASSPSSTCPINELLKAVPGLEPITHPNICLKVSNILSLTRCPIDRRIFSIWHKIILVIERMNQCKFCRE